MLKSVRLVSSGLLLLSLGACGMEEADEGADIEITSSALELAPNSAGFAESFHTAGVIDRTNPFFTANGAPTNPRSCETCHNAGQGWTLTPDAVGTLFNQTQGLAPLFMKFYEWAGELIERRRDDPGDDLISTLIEASHEGDRLDDPECMNLVLNVLVGGVDTTQSQLAHGLRVFAEHPDQWALLAERPELAAAAVEELLRYEPITPFTARLLHEEVEYRGVTFPADTVVMVCSFAGNRDGVDGDPEGFDITADRGAAKPLTFGAGIHYCLGANLARAELQEALAFLPERMRGLALDGEPELGSIHGIYGLERLPLSWS